LLRNLKSDTRKPCESRVFSPSPVLFATRQNDVVGLAGDNHSGGDWADSIFFHFFFAIYGWKMKRVEFITDLYLCQNLLFDKMHFLL